MKILKKIVFSFFLLYSFNVLAIKFNVIIPINIYTLFLVAIFDIPGIFLLFLLMLFFN